MAKFKKKILREDRQYSSPDGTIDVNLEAKEHWAKNVGDFIARGFDIPVFWDHPDDENLSRPVKRTGRRLRAKDQAGWLTSAAVSSDGSLDLEFDIPDRQDAERVEYNLAKVSPVIWDRLEDGAGEVHKNVFGAVDLVVHPVDHTQSPFEPATVACSLVRCSLNSKPKVYRMADDNDEDKKEEDVMEEASESSEDTNEAPPEPVEEVAVTEDSGRLEAVIQSLLGMNIVLSDDTDESNFLEHLEQALLTAAAHDGEGEGVTTDTNDLDVASPEFAALSLERKERVKERRFFESKHREEVAKKLSLAVSEGRVKPSEAKQWEPKLKSVKLSLDDNGRHQPGKLESFLASRDEVPKGTFWTPEQRTRMSALEVAKPPSGLLGDDIDNEEADEMVDGFFKRTKPSLSQMNRR